MPAERRLRSCLTAPIRAERACRRVLSGALLRLSRALAPGSPHHPRSVRSSTPSSSDSSLPSTPDGPILHTIALPPDETGEVHQLPTQTSDPRTRTPTYMPSPILANAHHARGPATPVPIRDATSRQTWTPSPSPSASTASILTHDAPSPYPPTYEASRTPTGSEFGDYDMTPQGAPRVLASPSSGALAHATSSRPPSITFAPQQHAPALAAFAPSPTALNGRLRPVTPPVVSPRVALGEMGIGVFINPDELEHTSDLGATRTPRASPRVTPYVRSSSQRRHPTRVVPLPPTPGDGNAVASGSRLAPLLRDEAEDAMNVDEPTAPVAASSAPARAPPGLPDAHSGTLNSALRSPTTPPGAPAHTHIGLPGTPSDGESEIPEDAVDLEYQRDRGLRLFVTGNDAPSPGQSLPRTIETTSTPTSSPTAVQLNSVAQQPQASGGRPASPLPPQTPANVILQLRALARLTGVPLPEDSSAEEIILLVGGVVGRLQRERGEEEEQRARTRRQLEDQMETDIVQTQPSLRLALGRILNDLKPSQSATQAIQGATLMDVFAAQM
ncbi:unnamed protein product [Peniophora sp. CBMAI 1063]|nr:unnamed protein product [Peniophora sp. CBMAI 1063]